MHKLAFILILIINISAKPPVINTWRLVRNENNISVYSRKSQYSDIKEIKVSAKVNASINDILKVIQDVTTYTQWVYLCTEAKTLKQIGHNEQIYYTVTNSPWPVQNRDAVIHGKTVFNKQTNEVIITSESYNNFFDKKEEYVRVKYVFGQWKLKLIKDDLVQLEYYIQINPGGDIPAWLINYSLQYGPFYTVSSLIYLVENKNNLMSNN
ncbi:MAG: hypothetical protein GXO79_03990 [Chlorobi bacterium]|nr:hypothetical protein [Chlorobiota bacterium]